MVYHGCKDESPFGDLCRDIKDDAVETAIDYLQKRLDS